MKGVEDKDSIMDETVDRKKSVPRDHSLASLGKSRNAKQWSSGRILKYTPHTHDRPLEIVWFIV